MVGTLMVSACSSGPATVSKSTVESQIVSKLSTTDGTRVDSASCPNDLAATVGATITCTISIGSQPGSADVVVTDVTDGNVKMNVKGR